MSNDNTEEMTQDATDQETTERYKIATVDEIAEDGSYVVEEIRGREIGVFNADGEYRAIANFCVHQSGPLCEGGLTGRYTVGDDGWEWHYDDSQKVVRCPWHNWGFDLESGINIKDDRYAVPTYEVEVDGDDIYVRF